VVPARGHVGVWEVMTFALIGLISIGMFAYASARDGISLRSIFYFFSLFFFFLVPYFAYEGQLWLYRAQYSQVLFTNLCILLFLLVYLGAHALAQRRWQERARAARAERVYVVQHWGVLLCFGAAIVFSLGLLAVTGWEFFVFRGHEKALHFLPLPAFLFVNNFMRPGTFVLLLVAIYWLKATPRPGLSQYLLVLGIGLLGIAVNLPTSTPRFYAFTLYLSLLFVVFPPKPSRALFYGLLMLLALAGSALMEAFRTAFVEFTFSRLDPTYLFVGHFDGYENFMLGIEYIERAGLQWGRQLAAVLFFWVPRAVWAEKPIATGTEIAEQYLSTLVDERSNVNISSPLPMEGYVDFGVLGIALYAAVFGIASGCLDAWGHGAVRRLNRLSGLGRKLELRRVSPDAIIAFPILVAMSLLWLRGGLNVAFSYTCGLIAAYLVLRRICIRTIRLSDGPEPGAASP
jgi:hypothetical protein